MPYYPPYYNPYLYQPPQQNQVTQNIAASTPPAAPSPGIIWVGSERDAALYPVAPNNAITLWNQNEPVVYLKQADATGKPALKVYDLVERPESPQDARKASEDKLPDYATKNELAAVVGAVRDIDGIISNLMREVDDLKSMRRGKKTEGEA